MDYLALLSLLFLIAVLVLGFIKKVNMGFLAMGMALIIARIGGIPDKTVISNFSTSLFITLVGPAFLFSMAVNNGTMDLLSRKMMKLVGKHLWCLPLIIALLTYVLSSCGCGNIPTFAIILPLGIALAAELGIDVIGMGLIITLACNMGCMSPISNGGIIAAGLVDQGIDLTAFGWNMYAECTLVWLVLTLAFFFIFKMYKPKAESISLLDNIPKFDKNQKITMIAIAAVVIVVFAFGVNIGLAAPLAAILLCIFGVTNDKAAIKIMPWGTFILVCGVNMLMAVVKALGGIDLLVSGLTSIMSGSTARPIMALAAGIMSWFSSTTGVVMPALIPTVTGILEQFPAAGYTPIVVSITITSFLAAFSPVSTGGAGVLAQYSVFMQGKGEQNTNKLFVRLFLTSVVCVLVSVLFAFIGVYNIFA